LSAENVERGGGAAGPGRLGATANGAAGECFDSLDRADLRRAAQHDNRQARMEVTDRRQNVESSHTGHFDIEGDDAGGTGFDFGQGGSTVGGDAGDLKVRFVTNQPDQELPHDDRIVDDEHPDLF
jgi:hypothetical protein